MRKKLLLSVMALTLLLTSCGQELTQELTEQQVTAFVNVDLVPMTDERIIESRTVLVEGTEIIQIAPLNEVAIPENATVINGLGAYLMPGLADMHMHTSDAWLSDDWPVSPLNLYLANGVTTIRDFETCGSDDLLVLRLREEIRKGSRDGPTMYTSGVILGGHRSLSEVFGTEDAHEIISELKNTGYDFVKMYSYLPEAKFYELVTEAEKEGMYTAGHIPFAVGLDGVLAAGMDEIAHVEELDWELYDFDRSPNLTSQEWDHYVFFETFPQQANAFAFDFEKFAAQRRGIISETVEKLRGSDISIGTNLIVSESGIEKLFKPEEHLARPENRYLPKSYLSAFKQGMTRLQQMAQMIGEENAFIDEDTNLVVFKRDMDTMWLRELKQVGVPLLLATDGGCGILGIVPGFSIHWELQILVENGFTPYEAIATGTVNAARVIDKMTGEGDFGTIEVGKRADLILVKENPLEDVAHIKEPLGVMAAGRWYSRETLEQMIAIEK